MLLINPCLSIHAAYQSRLCLQQWRQTDNDNAKKLLQGNIFYPMAKDPDPNITRAPNFFIFYFTFFRYYQIDFY